MEASQFCSVHIQPRLSSLVEAPFNYVRSLRANGVRDKFMHALNLWFCVPRDELGVIMDIVSRVHHLALMLDDIQDGSGLRREAPAAHRIYGTAQTINSGTHALLMCFVDLERLSNPTAARAIFVEEIDKMHSGQASDLNWKYLNLCPAADEYMAMIDGKSGAFFHLCVRLMHLSSSSGSGTSDTQPPTENRSILDFTNLLGRFFQIRDDYQNLMADDYAQRKGWCDDLDEGKRSLPLIYTITAASGKRDEILGILAHKEGAQMAPEMKRFILDQMRLTGALDKTMSLLKVMQQDLLDKAGKIDEECRVAHSGMAQVLKEGLWI